MTDTTLLVANDGGHIKQLFELAPRLGLDEIVWSTAATPQTEALLAGQRVEWCHPAPTRDVKAVLENVRFLRKVFKRHRPARVVSTGASLALSALPLGELSGTSAHYIESVTRAEDFSLSGRILRRTPGVEMYTQWPHLVDSRWRYRGSVLDGFTAQQRDCVAVNRIVVSVGTSQTFGFRRLLQRLVTVIPDGVDVLWQTGSTDVEGLGIDARPTVPGDKLERAIEEADVLVAHAGAGISLTGITSGRYPLIVPRLAERNEHIDNHQAQIARHLDEKGLAMVRRPEEITWADIEAAARFETHRDVAVEPFVLG